MNFIFFFFALSATAQSIRPVFKAPLDKCPVSYNFKNGWCVHKKLEFSLEASSSPSSVLLPIGNELKETNAHYVRLAATAKGSDGQKIPVSNAPVYYYPAERDQLIYQLDPVTGELIQKKVPAYSRLLLFTNAAGVVSFYVEIHNDEEILTQKMLVSSEFIENNELRFIQADQGAFKLLQNVKEEDVLKVKPDLASEDAEKLVKVIKLASTHILSKAKELQPLKTELELEQIMAQDLDEHDAWEKLRKEVIKGIVLFLDSGSKVLVAVITTGLRVVQFALQTAFVTFKVLIYLVGAVAVSLLNLLIKVSPVLQMDAVADTQTHLIRQMRIVHEQAYSLVDNNREKIIERMRSTTGSLESQVDKALDFLRKKVPSVPSVTDPSALAISDIIDANADRVEAVATAKQVSTITSRLDALEQLGIPQVNVLVLATRNALEREGKDLLRGLLTGIRGLISVFGTVATTAVDEAILLFNLVHDLFWDVLNLSVKVPFVSSWFKRVFKNDLSLVALLTIAPSMLYTYSYMITHLGERPFKGETGLVRRNSTDIGRAIAQIILVLLIFSPSLVLIIFSWYIWLFPVVFFILILWLLSI